MNELLSDGETSLLGEVGEPDAEGIAEAELAGRKVKLRVREAEPRSGEAPTPVPGQFHPVQPVREWPEAFITPSSQEGQAGLLGVTALGDRLVLSGAPDMQPLGEAIHTFLAAEAGQPAEEREAFAAQVLARWGVTGCVQPKALVAAGERLRAWAGQFNGAKWHREWPVFLKQANGSVLRGAADLVLETTDAWVLVDHKSFPGTREAAEARAQTHGGQLRAYAGALQAVASKPVRGFIHLPVTGQMVELSLTSAQAREGEA
jgi:ATP-dependent exoDNAse (exonuclease V) beta subunit